MAFKKELNKQGRRLQVILIHTVTILENKAKPSLSVPLSVDLFWNVNEHKFIKLAKPNE